MTTHPRMDPFTQVLEEARKRAPLDEHPEAIPMPELPAVCVKIHKAEAISEHGETKG